MYGVLVTTVDTEIFVESAVDEATLGDGIVGCVDFVVGAGAFVVGVVVELVIVERFA